MSLQQRSSGRGFVTATPRHHAGARPLRNNACPEDIIIAERVLDARQQLILSKKSQILNDEITKVWLDVSGPHIFIV